MKDEQQKEQARLRKQAQRKRDRIKGYTEISVKIPNTDEAHNKIKKYAKNLCDSARI